MSDRITQEEFDRFMNLAREAEERDGVVSPWERFLRSVNRTISYKEIPPAEPGSVLCEEWELYRREIKKLLDEGHEGKFILIKGSAILGIYDSDLEAMDVGYRDYPNEPFLCRPILSREPLIRSRW